MAVDLMDKEDNLGVLNSNETSSDDDDDVTDEEVESGDDELSETEENGELPATFDITGIQDRLEELAKEGPPSSSDDDEELDDEVDDDGNDEEDPEESAKEDDDVEEEADGEEVSGWADAMLKVLNTGKRTESDKPLLLSKAKKDSDIPGLKEGQTVEEGEKRPLESAAKRRAIKKVKDETGRTKPQITKDRARERKYQKVATRGVVQLFNAVREQQSTLKNQLDKVGLSTTKRDKVYKNLDKDTFLEVLSGKKRPMSTMTTTTATTSNDNSEAKRPKNEVKDEENDDGTWSVLKDNFMMGAKMRDWDKESDNSD